MSKKYRTINVSPKTFDAINYTAHGLGMTKKALMDRLFEVIVRECALLKLGTMNLETSHGYGRIELKFTGIPYCTLGTVQAPINITDRELDKKIYEKVYGEKNL